MIGAVLLKNKQYHNMTLSYFSQNYDFGVEIIFQIQSSSIYPLLSIVSIMKVSINSMLFIR